MRGVGPRRTPRRGARRPAGISSVVSKSRILLAAVDRTSARSRRTPAADFRRAESNGLSVDRAVFAATRRFTIASIGGSRLTGLASSSCGFLFLHDENKFLRFFPPRGHRTGEIHLGCIATCSYPAAARRIGCQRASSRAIVGWRCFRGEL